MKKYLVILGVLTSSLGSTSFGGSFEFDHGNLTVSFGNSAKPFSWSYQIPQACPNTKIEIDKSERSLAVRHVGKPCSLGTKFVLTLGESFRGEQVKLAMKNGTLSLPSEKSKYSQIKLSMNSGTVYAPGLKCHRPTSNPAGMRCEYQAPDKSGHFLITGTVGSGTISLLN